METDNEVKGSGNPYTTEFRQYDPRLGRWLTIDPLTAKYPWASPYNAFNDNPIRFTDTKGLEGQDWIGKKNKDGNTEWKWDENVKSKDQLPEGYTEYAKAGDEYPTTDGRYVRLGENTWNYIDGLTNNQGMPIDNDYTEQGLEAQRFHEKCVANAQALDQGLIDFTLIMTSPIGGVGGIGSKLAFSTVLKTGAVNGTINAIANFGSQLYANQGKTDNIDRLSVAFAFGSGFIPGKYNVIGNIGVGVADGMFDYTPSYDGNYNVFNDKPILQVLSDATFTTAGNLGNNAFGDVPKVFLQ